MDKKKLYLVLSTLIVLVFAAIFPFLHLFIVGVYDVLNTLVDSTEYNTKYHYFLQGNFAPITQEFKSVELHVLEGSIPNDICGLFIRIGPNPISHHKSRGYHWFDGHGMTHSIRITQSSNFSNLYYTNQFVQTPRYKLERKHDRPIFINIGELDGVIGLIKVAFLMPLIAYAFGLSQLTSGTANTNVLLYDDNIFFLQEASSAFKVVYDDHKHKFIEIGYESFSTYDTEHAIFPYPVTAHARVDTSNASKLYVNSYLIVDENNTDMVYGVLSRDSRQRNTNTNTTECNTSTSTVENDTITYKSDFNKSENSTYQVETLLKIKLNTSTTWIHDMAITEDYMLIVDSAIEFDKMNILKDAPLFEYVDTHLLRVGVIPKSKCASRTSHTDNDETNTVSGGRNCTELTLNDITWYVFDKAYAIIHVMTAWNEVYHSNSSQPLAWGNSPVSPAQPEEGDDMLYIYAPTRLEFNGLESMPVGKDGTVESRRDSVAILTKLVINLSKHTTYSSYIEPARYVEFPRVYPNLFGKKIRYGYASEYALTYPNYISDSHVDDASAHRSGNTSTDYKKGLVGMGVFHRVLKYDLVMESVVATIHLPQDAYCGEMVPIPKKTTPCASGGCDGSEVYLAGFVYNASSGVSEFHIYDGGEQMSSTPVARVQMPGGGSGPFWISWRVDG